MKNATLKLVDEQGNAVLNRTGGEFTAITNDDGEFSCLMPSINQLEKTYYLEVDAQDAVGSWNRVYAGRKIEVKYINARLLRAGYELWAKENLQPEAEELLEICRNLTGQEKGETSLYPYMNLLSNSTNDNSNLKKLYDAASKSEDLGFSYDELKKHVEELQEG